MRRVAIALLIAALAVVLLVQVPGLWRDAREAGRQAAAGVEAQAARGQGATVAAPVATRAGEPVLTAAGAPDYAEWERAAERTRTVIARQRASDSAYETLRGQLARWRAAFQAEAARHARPLSVLHAQIDALGPPPGEGEADPEAIAVQRAALTERLQNDRVPMLLAQSAAAEATGYIAEIDRILRDRRNADLLGHGPSLFIPANWTAALGELQSAWRIAARDVATNWSNDLQARMRAERMPAILVLAGLGSLMLVSGGRLLGGLIRRLLPRSRDGEGAELRWLLVRFWRLAVRLVGLALILTAIDLLGLQGARSGNLVDLVGGAASVLLIARWLALTLFSGAPGAPVFFGLTDRERGALRRSVLWLGIALALSAVFDVLRDLPSTDSDLLHLFDAPLLILGGLLLLRHGALLRKDSAAGLEDDTDAGDGGLRARTVGIAAGFVRLVGLVAPILTLAGYYPAADLLVFSTIGSLALAGALIILQRLIVDALTLLLRGRGVETGGAAGLIPILFGFALVVASLPLFAVIWGVRWAVLGDLWDRLRDGVTLGGVTFTVQNVAVFFVVFVLGYILTGLVKGALSGTILPRTRLDIGARDAIVTGTGYVGIILAAVLAVSMAGINLTGLAFVAGALSVGIGFGLRTIVENFVSGIILLVERPIKQGDWIDVGGTMGYVREISVRSTRIETFDRSDVVVPNADLITGKVTNYTYSNLVGRLIVPVGVAYGSDVDKVRRVLREVAEANPMVVLKPPPSILFRGFGDSALNFEIRAILRDVNWVLSVETEINTEIARRFAEEGIEIPFPQRDLWIRNAGDLRPAHAPAQAAPATQHQRPEDRGQLPAPDTGEQGDDR